MKKVHVIIISAALLSSLCEPPAFPHDMYTGVHGENGQVCCSDHDCSSTIYREIGGAFEFLTRENHWVAIPKRRIIFLPVPGDPPSNERHHAHLCYSIPGPGYAWAQPDDEFFFRSDDGAETINLYCAFIPPGGA
jgi:hypothetical protein